MFHCCARFGQRFASNWDCRNSTCVSEKARDTKAREMNFGFFAEDVNPAFEISSTDANATGSTTVSGFAFHGVCIVCRCGQYGQVALHVAKRGPTISNSHLHSSHRVRQWSIAAAGTVARADCSD